MNNHFVGVIVVDDLIVSWSVPASNGKKTSTGR